MRDTPHPSGLSCSPVFNVQAPGKSDDSNKTEFAKSENIISTQQAVKSTTSTMSPSAQKNPEAVVSRTSEVRQTNGDGKNGNSRKITTLRDATQRSITMYRTELDSSSEQFLTSCQSVETFFDFVAGIRLRQMPHHSSRWDKILKWAEFFAAQVYGYSDEVSHFADYAEQAAQIIWASCLSLLKVGFFILCFEYSLTTGKVGTKLCCCSGESIWSVLQCRTQSWVLPSPP